MSDVKRCQNHIANYEVEAVQFDGTKESAKVIEQWIGKKFGRAEGTWAVKTLEDISIRTATGWVKLNKGDVIVLSLEDDEGFFPYPEGVFEQMFTEINV